MLKARIITAICLFSAFLCSLWLPSQWFGVLVAVVFTIAAWEWAKLSGCAPYYQRVLYGLVTLIIALALADYIGFFSAALTDQSKVLSLFLGAGLWWAIALLWVQGYPSSAVLWGNQWIRLLIGLLVLIPSSLGLIFLHSQDQGLWLILFLVVIVATADTGAYFSGRAFGKRKLAKNVSPGKSWEGVVGGLLACMLLALGVAVLTGLSSWLVLLCIVLPTALVSVLGDLLESMVKRYCGIKDSGRILPGHGGVLDRIDGLTAAVPIFSLAIILSDWQLTL